MNPLRDRLLLRPETVADHESVDALTDAAFTSLPPGSPGHGQSTPTIERRLLGELRVDGDLIDELTLVAELDGEVVGHVACSAGVLGEAPSVGLGPISVRPDLQRQGIGAALMSAVVATAERRADPVVVLLGDPDYYGFFGFVPAARLGITPPEPWGDAFQAKTLRAWHPGLAGPFTYAPAFSRL